MALSQNAYSGRDIDVTIGVGAASSVTRWKSYSMEVTRATVDASGADSDYDEVLRSKKILNITLTGLVGAATSSERSFAASPGSGTILPLEGQEITGYFTVKSGSDNILPDISDFTKVKVLTMKVTGDEGAQQWELTARSGVLN